MVCQATNFRMNGITPIRASSSFSIGIHLLTLWLANSVSAT